MVCIVIRRVWNVLTSLVEYHMPSLHMSNSGDVILRSEAELLEM